MANWYSEKCTGLLTSADNTSAKEVVETYCGYKIDHCDVSQLKYNIPTQTQSLAQPRINVIFVSRWLHNTEPQNIAELSVSGNDIIKSDGSCFSRGIHELQVEAGYTTTTLPPALKDALAKINERMASVVPLGMSFNYDNASISQDGNPLGAQIITMEIRQLLAGYRRITVL